ERCLPSEIVLRVAAAGQRRPRFFFQEVEPQERNVMKRIAALLLLLLTTVTGFGQGANAPIETTLSPAERSMAQARKLIEKNPKDFEAYNALALALSRRARETSDVKFYTQAEEALQKSFEVSTNNFDGQRIQVWL